MPTPTPGGKRNQPVPIGEESEQYRGWRSVSRGLRLIQVGMWMFFLPALFEAGKLAYFHFGKVVDASPGFLGLGNTQWVDITILAWLVPVILGEFLILIGRVGLTGVPLSTEARGIASGGMIFELGVFLGTVAVVTIIALIRYGTIAGQGTLAEAMTIAPMVVALLILLSEVWYLLFLCQVGFPVGEPKMTRRVANFFLLFVFATIAPPLVAQVQPMFGMGDFATADAREMNRLISWGGAVVVLFIGLFLYTRLAGKVRQAIRRMIQDREPVNVMVR